MRQVHEKFAGNSEMWQGYVEKCLLPRLNGFELLMASYAMAHLKLDWVLKETGYEAKSDNRLQIYLTDSLQEAHPDTGTMFASWLSNESQEADRVKRETPIMVVLGNPPYNGESQNNGEWIRNLIEVYKREPSGGALRSACSLKRGKKKKTVSRGCVTPTCSEKGGTSTFFWRKNP